MSHISTYKSKIASVNLFLHTCEDRGYPVIRGKQIVRQFGSNKVDAIASISITGWKYPVAITKNGELKYDHWGSQSDSFKLLGETIQEYNMLDILHSIPYHEISNLEESKDKEGAVVITLTY